MSLVVLRADGHDHAQFRSVGEAGRDDQDGAALANLWRDIPPEIADQQGPGVRVKLYPRIFSLWGHQRSLPIYALDF